MLAKGLITQFSLTINDYIQIGIVPKSRRITQHNMSKIRRDITREGFTLRCSVADLVSNEGWRWPQSWLLKAPILGQIHTPTLDVNKLDMHFWRDSNGAMSKLSVKAAWEAFRPRGIEVPWFRVVWFSHNIPRHAFHLWLVMRKSLKTQDKLRQWDVGNDTDLNLLRSTSYYVWSERNNRLFKKVKRTPDEIRDIIMVTVRTLGSMEVNLLDEEVSLAMDSLDSLVRGLGAVSKLCKSNLDVH
ncbi:reverse transcriptase domain, reverse transcriptase zinc-binding domain protein [Tanacetum coccineum]